MTDRLALVIPCFNEAARLDQQALRDAVTRYAWLDLVLVDDGSTDTTAAALGALAATAPSRICVVSLASNGGKAEAVRRGLQVAMTRAPYCGFWDADLSAPLDELVALRELFTRFPAVQWVWGIRLRALGRQVTRQPLRHYLGRVFATATSLALGVDSYDTQCGAKLFRSSGWLATVLAEPFLSRWIFDVEMVTRLKGLLQANGGAALSQAVYEQPLAVWTHRAGSKVRSGDFVKAVMELLTVRRDSARWRRAVASKHTVGSDGELSYKTAAHGLL